MTLSVEWILAAARIQHSARREIATNVQGAPLKMFGWLGTVAGLIAFLLIHDEMAALLFWVGLGMLIHASSPWKEFPLWELFLTARRPFRLSFHVILAGGLVFSVAYIAESWFIRYLFESLGALLSVVGIAALVAATQASTTHGQPPSR
jgi:hypothetical protein